MTTEFNEREYEIWRLALAALSSRTVRWRTAGGMAQVAEIRATIDHLSSPAAFVSNIALLDVEIRRRERAHSDSQSYPKPRPPRPAPVDRMNGAE